MFNIKGRRKVYHANTSQKKAGMVTVISDEVEFSTKNITRMI